MAEFDFFKSEQYVEYCSKKDLEGLQFKVVDYVLVPGKKQYSGAVDDTYVVTLDVEGVLRKLDVPKAESRKTGKPSRMFQMFENADQNDHFIPSDEMTMEKVEYDGGYFWKLNKSQ